MTGLHAALAALADELHDDNMEHRLRALLDEHPADLPVATDSTTADAHVIHVTATPVAEDVVWCDECEEWVASGAPERAPAPEPSDRAGLSEVERTDLCATVYKALNRKLGEPDQGSGTNGRRWDLAWEITSAVESDVADRLAEAERERNRQREARDRWIGIAQQFQAKAEAAEQEAATLRTQVAAVWSLHGKTHWCFGGDDVNDLRDDKVFEPGTEHWPCPTVAALGDSAQVVQRIKDEATEAAAALVDAEVESEVKRLTDAFGGDPLKSPMLNNWLGGMWTAAKVIRGERS
ncbi:hypothetical protein GUY44_07505 [Pimelobacter simplex]|nr:hypothetical protein [Pimelobacter simplex]MCG8150320.1 hypothetical protein [Pimelobacter simplex]GEB16686.1 hypothetical protein NSI01_50010 [Pimelobacter simplex]SFM90019.1 hypothetical protein SAMN05421671_4097 [Pimelobacter simplex]